MPVLEYFTLRRKPQDVKSPVLNEEDEKFLSRITSEDTTPADPNTAMVILEGSKVPVKDAQVALMAGADKIPLPTSPPPETEAQAPGGEGSSSEPDKQKRNYWSYLQTVPVKDLFKGKAKRHPSGDSQNAAASSNKEGVDVTTDDVATEDSEKTKKEREDLTSILDQLNLAAVNNRVFSFSKESQKLMEEFKQVLKDIINGVPTAYDDMEKLLKRYDGQLKKMFGDMPPYVQALVKALPAKIATTLGPEFMAASSEKPGFDGKMRMEALGEKEGGKKKSNKSKVPSLKKLVSQQGAVAGMLRSIVEFLKLRFPAFITGTNVIMSLAVFLLLFVFWYCHKRGREVRLSKEAADAESDLEKSVMTELDESIVMDKPKGSGADTSSPNIEPPNDDDISTKYESILNQKDPATVHLPKSEGDKTP